MNFKDSLNLALNSLLHRRLRAWLTLLGIVIGVAAVVAIISVGEGAQASVGERLSTLGADVITVSPGYSRAGRSFGNFRGGNELSAGTSNQNPLTDRDAITLRGIPEIAFINERATGSATAAYLAEEVSVSVQGINPVTWRFLSTTEIASGRYLMQGDLAGVVLGYRVATEFFKQPIGVGNTLVLNKKPFRVVGVLKESLSGSDDSAAFILNYSAQDILEGVKDKEYNSIQVKLVEGADPAAVAETMDKRLMLSRHVTERDKDFTVSSTQAIATRITDVTQTMTLFLIAIAAVSLLVGSIGIANSMFTSVMEKTKEIGILKALGSSNEEILRLFLIESGLFGLVGGVLGVLVGAGLSSLIPLLGVRLMGGAQMTAIVKPELVAFAVLFSTVIGVGSGAAPALQAAKLHPVDALRYE